MKTIFEKHELYEGRMICPSKSAYRSYTPEGKPYFNAVLFIEENKEPKKIWWGDIDITFDGKKLKEISKEINQTIFVLTEYEGHLKDNPNLKNAVWNTTMEV